MADPGIKSDRNEAGRQFIDRFEAGDELSAAHLSKIADEVNRLGGGTLMLGRGRYDPMFAPCRNKSGSDISRWSVVEMKGALGVTTMCEVALPSAAALDQVAFTPQKIPDGAMGRIVISGWALARVEGDPAVGDYAICQKDSGNLLTFQIGHFQVLSVLGSPSWLPVQASGTDWCIVTWAQARQGVLTSYYSMPLTDCFVLNVETV